MSVLTGTTINPETHAIPVTIHATLCLIIRDGRVLLLHKNPGRFGEGKWNGAGGKLLPGESPEAGVAREVEEETGLRLRSAKHHGVLDFYFGEKPEPDWTVHVFSSRDYAGEPRKSSEEGALRWFSIDEIPYHSMWQDDAVWLPLLLEGRTFSGRFNFNEDGSRLLSHTLTAQ